MAAIHKFLFDTDFTVYEHPKPEPLPANAEAPDGEAGEPEEETPPPPPTYSEEDLEVARGQGFTEGKQEGIREAAAAVEQQIAATLAQIGGRLPELFAAQGKAAEELSRGGIVMIRALAHKVLPGLAERDALAEVEHLAGLVLERLRSEPRVVFRVNDGLLESVKQRVTAVAQQTGLSGSIEVIGEAGIAAGDCRVEWSDGGAERRTASLLGEIDQIIARNLGGTVDDLVIAAAPTTPETEPAEAEGAAPEAAPADDDDKGGGAPDAQ